MTSCRHNPSPIKPLAASALLLGAFPLAHAITPLLLRDTAPVCPFRAATGKPCPLCGLTRAIALATHGRWRDAFAMNLLWPLFAGVMLALAGMSLIDAATGRHSAARFVQRLSERWILIFAALSAFGIGRIAFHW